jgi:serine protease
VVLASCGPPPIPASPHLPKSIVPTAPTTVASPPKTSVPPPCTVSGASASGAAAASVALPADDGPAPITTTSGITRAAQAAATTAERTGADQVTVVAVDADGRPSLVPATPDDAVSVALATAEVLDVVAVEVPSIAHALVEADAAGSSDPLVPQEWAQQSFQFSALWPCGKGSGVTVAVIDTGVQANHPDLVGRVLPGAAFLNGGAGQVGAGGTDPNGHGTHVAGIIAAADNGVGVVGVAPEATILPIRALGADGSGFSSDIAHAITWAVDHGANVVNLSLGADVDSPSMDAAVSYATSHGVVVVAAAGNTGAGGTPEYPAALPSVVAVAALNADGSIASYSTRGSYVDVAAPGSSILSTYPTSAWAIMSGTSMASPHVAGLAALIIDGRGAIAPAAMLARLTSTATDAGDPGFDPAYGFGRINPVAALNAP